MQLKLPMLMFLIATFSCGSPTTTDLASVRPLTTNERLADFDQLVEQVRAFYGPLDYKESRFPEFKFEKEAARLREQVSKSSTDEEFYSLVSQLVAMFDDGHVSVNYPSDRISSKSIPLIIEPIEDRAIVRSIDSSLSNEKIKIGDEVVAVDGVPPFKYLQLIRNHMSFGNDVSTKHFLYRVFRRPSYMQGEVVANNGKRIPFQPQQPFAEVQFQSDDGNTYKRTLLWRTIKDRSVEIEFVSHSGMASMFSQSANEYITAKNSGISELGVDTPLLATPEVIKKFKLGRVYVDKNDKERLSAFSTKAEDIDENVYAAWFSYRGKNIMYVRQPSYAVKNPEERIKTYRLLLAQHEERMDALIVDQMHNPGGLSDYLEAFTGLFATQGFRSYVQFMNADRKWLGDVHANFAKLNSAEQEAEDGLRYLQIASDIEQSYNAGQRLTKLPYSFTGSNYIKPDEHYTWKKPIIVLADELSGSCGDLFPMMMQRNGRAIVVGNRIMGLGGSVEEMDALTHSRIKVKLTRGLLTDYNEDGTYPTSNFIENNGVTPDHAIPRTVADSRTGYISYFEQVAELALKQAN